MGDLWTDIYRGLNPFVDSEGGVGFDVYTVIPGTTPPDEGAMKQANEALVNQRYGEIYSALDDAYRSGRESVIAGNTGATRRGIANIQALGSRVAPGGVMGALQRGYEEESDRRLRTALAQLEAQKQKNIVSIKSGQAQALAGADAQAIAEANAQRESDNALLGQVLGAVGTFLGAQALGGLGGGEALTGIPELDIPVDIMANPDSVLPVGF